MLLPLFLFFSLRLTNRAHSLHRSWFDQIPDYRISDLSLSYLAVRAFFINANDLATSQSLRTLVRRALRPEQREIQRNPVVKPRFLALSRSNYQTANTSHPYAHLCETPVRCILLFESLSMDKSEPKARVTLSDIARKLNVSHTTVSRALRDDRQISKSLCKRIQQEAQQMGYRPDAMLTALAHYRQANKPPHIATGIAWINHWPKPEQLRRVHEFDLYWQGAVTEAERSGYRLEEFRLDKQMTSHRLEKVLLARNIPGILIPPWWHGEYPKWNDFGWENFCIVRFGHTITTPRVHLVTADQLYDSLLAYENIWKKGYKRIGLVTTAFGGKRLRFLAGYLFAQAQVDASPRLSPLLFSEPPGQESVPKLAAWLKATKPDAILTDHAPVPGLLARAGYRVPEDFGLATTSVVEGNADAGIYQNSDEVGRAAIQLLISLIHHNERGIPRVHREVLVEGEWVDGSTLPDRAANR